VTAPLDATTGPLSCDLNLGNLTGKKLSIEMTIQGPAVRKKKNIASISVDLSFQLLRADGAAEPFERHYRFTLRAFSS
jgi:hypothetical protein